MDSATIQQLIETGLPQAQVLVEGEDGTHFSATVICPSFVGLSSLQRHRAVYATLGDKMGGAIHALALTTLTPDEAS